MTVICVTEAEKQFLYLFRCHINNEKLPDGYQFDIGRVFSLAQIHNVLPAVYETACQSSENVSCYKMTVVKLFGNQVIKNAAFRELYNEMQSDGIDAIVLKGPVCSFCYDKPDYRLSSDFDIIVDDSQRETIHDFLLNRGFQQFKGAYLNHESGLYIEVDTQLSEGNGIIKEMADKVFDGFRERCVFVDSYKTLGYTDCLVYLVYHAFKHFVGSGFGVRQLADIGLFIRKFKAQIDFDCVDKMISSMGIKTFYENVIACFNKYLSDEPVIFCNEEVEYICTEEFISDLLSAGVFGKSSEDRLHSANLVLNAVNNKKSGILHSLFPSYTIMKSKFSILSYIPILLPVLWLIRLLGYILKSVGKNKKVSPSKTVEIANSRIELMKKMNIIEQ